MRVDDELRRDDGRLHRAHRRLGAAAAGPARGDLVLVDHLVVAVAAALARCRTRPARAEEPRHLVTLQALDLDEEPLGLARRLECALALALDDRDGVLEHVKEGDVGLGEVEQGVGARRRRAVGAARLLLLPLVEDGERVSVLAARLVERGEALCGREVLGRERLEDPGAVVPRVELERGGERGEGVAHGGVGAVSRRLGPGLVPLALVLLPRALVEPVVAGPGRGGRGARRVE